MQTLLNIYRVLVSCCLIAISPGLLAVENTQPPTQQLTVGETYIIPAKSLKRVAVGNGDILQVEALEEVGEVLVIAKEPGISDVIIWDLNGKKKRVLINVKGYVEGPTEKVVNALFSDIDGIEIRKIDNSFVIEGTASTVREHERIQAIAEAYSNIYSLVFPPEFEHKQTVLIHAQFLEVNRNALEEIGINWSDAINGPVFSFLDDYSTNNYFRGTGLPGNAILNPALSDLPNAISGSQQYFGWSTSLTSAINLLKTNGDAKLLAEPTLSCISGGSADFLAGGEVPIPVSGNDGEVTVIFKEFGISLNIQPLVDESGYIQTEVAIEVSAVDESVSVLGIPGFASRKASTEMHAESGQTIVLAGLFSQEGSKSVDKVPGLGDLPIVGELFKSRAFRNNESELIVLVTPRIVDNQAESEKGMKLFERLQQESDDALKFSIMD
ncbi:type II and III secretion system protein family protein [Shewanella chilikensis]|uniref:type II and III secretion system protein family protein n=1 Tax=Shewanella chilikensis TaxID=558541 RepID=UPI003A96BAE9